MRIIHAKIEVTDTFGGGVYPPKVEALLIAAGTVLKKARGEK